LKKKIAKPENWQDFESLCKKLWGEIWQCPNEIKKNGRQGQKQNGIDIYAIPKDQNSYWGIQCKGKDDYSNAKLTLTEIDEEIDKARGFIPPLEVFIFATTANKDSEVEEYIRLKNIENRKNGSFSIHLFCWEDIADLIEENRQTFQWYVGQNQFKAQHDIEVLWSNNTPTIDVTPVFNKAYVNKNPSLRPKLTVNHDALQAFRPYSYLGSQENQHAKINRSWCELDIFVENTGGVPLEDWKLIFHFEKKFENFSNELEANRRFFGGRLNDYRTTFFYPEEGEIIYKPKNNSPLVQTDSRVIDIQILPFHDAGEINIEWKLVARDFSKTGSLKLNINTEYRYLINGVPRDVDIFFQNDELNINDYEVHYSQRIERK
jgi:hypothetical protein